MRVKRKEQEFIVGPTHSHTRISHAAGKLAFWNYPPRIRLPLYPCFVHRLALSAGEYSSHALKDNCCFELPLEGSIFICERESRTLVTPGMAGIIHRGEDSRVETGPEGFCRKLSFGLKGSALHMLMAAAGLSDKVVFRLADPSTVYSRIGELERGLNERNPAEYGTLCGIAMALLTDFALGTASDQDERLAGALEILAVNIANPITVGEVARLLGISIMTLERLFRNNLGKSPGAYLTELRMQSASELLVSTRLPIQTVAERIGCQNLSVFSRQFRNYAACSPTEFRRRFSAR